MEARALRIDVSKAERFDRPVLLGGCGLWLVSDADASELPPHGDGLAP